MTNPTPTQNQTTPSLTTPRTLPGPLRCLIGVAIASPIAYGLYFLTSAIAQSFAAKPIHTDNIFVANITVAVRTLVVGMSALATGIFSLIALGLLALAVQVAFERLKNPSLPPSEPRS